MRIIFSRDRPAQLDLLLRSLTRNMPPRDDTRIVWFASNEDYLRGYGQIPTVNTPPHAEGGFDAALREALGAARDTVTFFCDDDIVYRRVPRKPSGLLLSDERILTVCLYLGRGNVKQKIPEGFPVWRWPPLDRHDFGFPSAIDGNTYRTEDVLRLIGATEVESPRWLEALMARRVVEVFAQDRPLMTCFLNQCLVSVPVNRVEPDGWIPSGRTFPQDPETLNRRFLSGERIDLYALDFSGVDSCHHEIDFAWEKP